MNSSKISSHIRDNPEDLPLYVSDYEAFLELREVVEDLFNRGFTDLPESLLISLILRNDPLSNHPNFPLIRDEIRDWEKIQIDDFYLFFPRNTFSRLKYELLPYFPLEALQIEGYSFSPLLFHVSDFIQDVKEYEIRPLENSAYDIYFHPGRVKILPVASSSVLLEVDDFIHWVSGYTLEGHEIRFYMLNSLLLLLNIREKDDGLIIYTGSEIYYYGEESKDIFTLGDPQEVIPFIEIAYILPKFQEWKLDRLSYLTYADSNGVYESFRSPVDLRLFLKNLKEGRIEYIENVIFDSEIVPYKIYSSILGFIN